MTSSKTAGIGAWSNVFADFQREAIGIELGFWLPYEPVIRALKQIISLGGKPQQNVYVELFNRSVRYEWLS